MNKTHVPTVIMGALLLVGLLLWLGVSYQAEAQAQQTRGGMTMYSPSILAELKKINGNLERIANALEEANE